MKTILDLFIANVHYIIWGTLGALIVALIFRWGRAWALEIKASIKCVWVWFRQTSTIVGMPTVIILIGMGVNTMYATTSCMFVGSRCEAAFGVSGMAQKYLTSLVTGSGEMEFKPIK